MPILLFAILLLAFLRSEGISSIPEILPDSIVPCIWTGSLPARFDDLVDRAGRQVFGAQYDADTRFGRALRAIIWNESQGCPKNYLGDVKGSPGCNAWCVSMGPSIGPMQVLQATAVQYKLWTPPNGAPYTQEARDAYRLLKNDEEKMVLWGATVFSKKLQEQGGSIYNALRAYNGGVTNPVTATYADKAWAWADGQWGSGALS